METGMLIDGWERQDAIDMCVYHSLCYLLHL